MEGGGGKLPNFLLERGDKPEKRRAECGKSKVYFITFWLFSLEFVGNKAKGRISERVFQENKARQIFRKTNISFLLIRTRTDFWEWPWIKVTGIYEGEDSRN